jgi:AcrR family transcriptional regulator
MAQGTTRRKGGRKAPARPETPRRRDREVLDAAAKVFHARGYADASVQDIADELGILKGSLYHYIDSKEDLLLWILTETHDDVQAILEEVAEQGLRPLEALREYTRRQVEYTTRNLERMSIYYHDSDHLSAERLREVVAKRKRHEQFVIGLLEQAQAGGEADPGADPRLTMGFLFGSMIWIYRWYRPGGRTKPAELADSCADFILRGVVGGTG